VLDGLWRRLGIDTSTAIGRMFFQILGAIADFEHALMSERARDVLDAASARGRTGGQNQARRLLGKDRAAGWRPYQSQPPER
jgi:DNA invertase Pin-like site-specific DNA recombinase